LLLTQLIDWVVVDCNWTQWPNDGHWRPVGWPVDDVLLWFQFIVIIIVVIIDCGVWTVLLVDTIVVIVDWTPLMTDWLMGSWLMRLSWRTVLGPSGHWLVCPVGTVDIGGWYCYYWLLCIVDYWLIMTRTLLIDSWLTNWLIVDYCYLLVLLCDWLAQLLIRRPGRWRRLTVLLIVVTDSYWLLVLDPVDWLVIDWSGVNDSYWTVLLVIDSVTVNDI